MALVGVNFAEAREVLERARNILILLGAGLSAPSGIPTFQETWENRDPRDMANASFFHQDPVTSWRFYEDRRQKALRAEPNAGHKAIAQFASRNERVFTITQNIDELSNRSGHPSPRLVSLHGSLFDVKCSSQDCDYFTTNHSAEPIFFKSVLRELEEGTDVECATQLQQAEIPLCPSCKNGLLRPGVVWFGDKLPSECLGRIDRWFNSVERIDLVMVVGTQALVQPAASYIHQSAEKGARVMHFNKDALRPEQEDELDEIDLFVQGDVAESLPFLLNYT
ncbi:hypothetical protein WHR41_07984 [Cladosporium halotolerans]|uniref:Deacetylase sirtuin-type domain-containing protein n=1 Tax=Cladosporium halotolerans TaxID=1052096 RepID=A0AB34KJP9_9PEZI